MWMIWTLEKFIPPKHHSGKDKTFGYGITGYDTYHSAIYNIYSLLYLKMYCSLVSNARIISWVKVLKQITLLVIINAMHHLRLFTLSYDYCWL